MSEVVVNLVDVEGGEGKLEVTLSWEDNCILIQTGDSGGVLVENNEGRLRVVTEEGTVDFEEHPPVD